MRIVEEDARVRRLAVRARRERSEEAAQELARAERRREAVLAGAVVYVVPGPATMQ